MAIKASVFPVELRDSFTFFEMTAENGPKRLAEIEKWLADPARPGFYGVAGTWFNIYNVPHAFQLAITDPDVAIEFKLRWC